MTIQERNVPVKIHPNYRRGQAVYVNDASRAVGVTSALMSQAQRPGYVTDIRAEYARIAAAHARGEQNNFLFMTASNSPVGPYFMGSVGPNIANTFVPTAHPRCIGALSLVMSSFALFNKCTTKVNKSMGALIEAEIHRDDMDI